MLFCHRVVLLSNRELKQAERFPFTKKKLALVPLGIKPPVLMSVDGAKQFFAKKIGMEFGEFDRKTVIINNAELHPNKGQIYLVDAMARVVEKHPNTICIIVSDGQEKAALHMQIKGNKLENSVFLVGYVDQAAEYLKAFSFFVLPSIKEGLPYVILEAGAASLPVIATTVGGIPELITDMKSGILVQPKNSKELAHAISFMIEHPEERRMYGAALHEKVLKDFSMEKMLAKIGEEYEE